MAVAMQGFVNADEKWRLSVQKQMQYDVLKKHKNIRSLWVNWDLSKFDRRSGSKEDSAVPITGKTMQYFTGRTPLRSKIFPTKVCGLQKILTAILYLNRTFTITNHRQQKNPYDQPHQPNRL
jgi:hypothetical protein